VDGEALLTAVERENRALLRGAEGNLDRPVPGCPGFDVAQLMRHLGAVHRWAAQILRSESTERPHLDSRPAEPSDPAELPGWFEAGFQELVDTFRTVAADKECYTWRGKQTPAWWRRRQALEAAIHRVDVEQAAGIARPEVDGELAVVGIDEHIEIFLPYAQPPETLGEAGRTVHLHATDRDGEWLFRVRAGGVDVTRGHAKGDAAVRGTASDLFLFIWRRLDAGDLEVLGDRDAAVLLYDQTMVG
jgi:uncharacterized protein (TIGR03083 family)